MTHLNCVVYTFIPQFKEEYFSSHTYIHGSSDPAKADQADVMLPDCPPPRISRSRHTYLSEARINRTSPDCIVTGMVDEIKGIARAEAGDRVPDSLFNSRIHSELKLTPDERELLERRWNGRNADERTGDEEPNEAALGRCLNGIIHFNYGRYLSITPDQYDEQLDREAADVQRISGSTLIDDYEDMVRAQTRRIAAECCDCQIDNHALDLLADLEQFHRRYRRFSKYNATADAELTEKLRGFMRRYLSLPDEVISADYFMEQCDTDLDIPFTRPPLHPIISSCIALFEGVCRILRSGKTVHRAEAMEDRIRRAMTMTQSLTTCETFYETDAEVRRTLEYLVELCEEQLAADKSALSRTRELLDIARRIIDRADLSSLTDKLGRKVARMVNQMALGKLDEKPIIPYEDLLMATCGAEMPELDDEDRWAVESLESTSEILANTFLLAKGGYSQALAVLVYAALKSGMRFSFCEGCGTPFVKTEGAKNQRYCRYVNPATGKGCRDAQSAKARPALNQLYKKLRDKAATARRTSLKSHECLMELEEFARTVGATYRKCEDIDDAVFEEWLSKAEKVQRTDIEPLADGTVSAPRHVIWGGACADGNEPSAAHGKTLFYTQLDAAREGRRIPGLHVNARPSIRETGAHLAAAETMRASHPAGSEQHDRGGSLG